MMTRKPAPPPDDAEQSKRFIDTAKEVEADDDKALERAFMKIKTNPPASTRSREKPAKP
jgi:hypothetical protein